MPQPARGPHRTASPAAHIPSTLWAAGPDPIPPAKRWPHPLLTRAVHEFSRPGDRVLLALPATSKRLRALPAGTDAALTVIDGLDRHAQLDHPSSDSAAQPAEDSALVLASLLPDCHDPATAGARIADLAAARLTGGGLLVVFTRCAHAPSGILLDPTGAVVTAAQAADLLFLQHIVAAPITGDTVAASTTHTDTTDDTTERPHHAVVHTDVLAFVKCTYEPGDTGDLAA